MLKVSGDTSTNIGIASTSSITLTVAGYEKSETKTSSPFPTPNILKQVHKAVVADDVVKQYLALVNLIISEMK